MPLSKQPRGGINPEDLRGSTPSKISSLKLGKDIAVVIGPEGGFTESEVNDIAEIAKTVSLGNRILRAETAAVVATTLVLSNKGEL